MPYRLLEYSEAQTVNKLGGLRSIHPKIQAESFAFQGCFSLGQVWTYPVLKGIHWILENCEGRRLYVENVPIDPELSSVMFGMTKPPGWGKQPFLIRSENDSETYVLRQEVVDVFDDLDRIGVLAELPLTKTYGQYGDIHSIEQLMPFAHFRWPALVQVYDSVQRRKPLVNGRIRQWVLDEVLQQGFGMPVNGTKNNNIGRSPLNIMATPAGGKLIDLLRPVNGFYVDDAMRIRGHKPFPGENSPNARQLTATEMFRRRFLDA
jgi:hypothetical protein